jgi:predicted nucleic acid-binding protein
VIITDARVLIAFLDSTDALHEQARNFMRDIAGQERGTSTVTIAEVLVGPTRSGRLADAEDVLRALRLREITLPIDAPFRLANVRASSQLKLPDCCVLVAAQDSHADAIATFDDRLRRVAEAHGFTTLP